MPKLKCLVKNDTSIFESVSDEIGVYDFENWSGKTYPSQTNKPEPDPYKLIGSS